jgi:short-subunit dehydrogenase
MRRKVLPRRFDTALITGATSGIGAAFAEVLPSETHLLLTGRREARLQAASRRLASPGRRVDVVTADLATKAGREAIIRSADAAGIDLFICNAGAGVYGPFLSHEASEELEALELNVVACVLLLRGLLPGMLARAHERGKRAGIVIVTSRAALGPVPELATYAASKAFQLRFAQALGDELKGEPIDVLALCPSYTNTEFFKHAGAPRPAREMMPAATVARDALSSLGRRAVHFCGNRLQVFALMEMLLR